ncbi:hypothetical protein X798_00015 [Onchocerca flexuosa]|uniref:Uncharacterized protein n=1 Tax=Onchocerca flexuosa TaxID=387005 RepID=A0A238C4T2_9BILA|nr:hypothetical protein X798_00015 [Onchocerca flexuosa]
MYRRQMEHGRRSRHERRTVWLNRSVSPPIERSQYATGSTLDRYHNHSEQHGNFTVNESSSPNGRPKHRHRERLDNSRDLSRSANRMSPSSVKIGPMENREYLEHELAKQYRGNDRLIAVERSRSKEIRLHDEVNHNASRIEQSEYSDGRMQNYHSQTESQLATNEIAGKISNNLANWRIEDMLGGQSVLNADSIQNAQTWIANDNSLSPAQIVRARELLQELLITITTKPDMPVAGGNIPTTMRQAIYIEERSFPHDRPPNFVTDHRISDYTSSRNFSQQSMQSALRSETKICGRELPVMQNSLSLGVPLTLPSQSWRKDPLVVYSDSSEIPINSRDIPKNPDFCCGSRSDYPIVHTESAEFGKGNAREHNPIPSASEKRKSHYRDRHRISRSRSRSSGKGCEASVGKRRVPTKYRDFISVGVNHQQKESRRNYLSDEADRRHRRGSRGERNLRHSSPLMRDTRRRR